MRPGCHPGLAVTLRQVHSQRYPGRMSKSYDQFVYLDLNTEENDGEVCRRSDLPGHAYLGGGTVTVDVSDLDPKDTSGEKVTLEVWIVDP